MNFVMHLKSPDAHHKYFKHLLSLRPLNIECALQAFRNNSELCSLAKCTVTRQWGFTLQLLEYLSSFHLIATLNPGAKGLLCFLTIEHSIWCAACLILLQPDLVKSLFFFKKVLKYCRSSVYRQGRTPASGIRSNMNLRKEFKFVAN